MTSVTSVAFKIPMTEKRQPKFGGLTANQLGARLDRALIQRDIGLIEIDHGVVSRRFLRTVGTPFVVFCPTIVDGQAREEIKMRVRDVLVRSRPSPVFAVIFGDPISAQDIRVAPSGNGVKFFV